MLIFIPFLIVIALIVAIDQIYFSDATPKEAASKKELQQKSSDANATQKYLDRYIKK